MCNKANMDLTDIEMKINEYSNMLSTTRSEYEECANGNYAEEYRFMMAEYGRLKLNVFVYREKVMEFRKK